MPYRAWLLMFAITGILIAFFSVPLDRALPAPFAQYCQDQGNHANDEECTAYSIVSPFIAPIGRFLEKNSAAISAVATAFIAYFTFTLWNANKALYATSNRSADAAAEAVSVAREAGRVQMRAYINVHETKAEYLSDEDGFPEQIRFMIIIKNTGQSPGKNVTVWATCHASPIFMGKVPAKDTSLGSVNPIGPGGDLKLEFGTNSRGLPIEAVQAVRARRTKLWVHGVVEYSDIFDRRQELGFRFEIEGGPVKKPQVYVCSEGNYST